MNYTQHYQLPQWVESDRIQMQDFNTAMIKLDQGIQQALEASPWQRLKQVTVTAAAEEVTLDVGSLNLTDYYELHLYCEFSPTTTGGVVSLRINDLTVYYDGSNTYDTLSVHSFGKNPADSFCCFRINLCGHVGSCCDYTYGSGSQYWSGRSEGRVALVPAAEVKKLKLRCYGALIGTGTQLKLFGVKK